MGEEIQKRSPQNNDRLSVSLGVKERMGGGQDLWLWGIGGQWCH